MAAPPLIGRRLRPSVRRLLPRLLAAVGHQIEEGPRAAETLHAASLREVGAEHAVAVAQEHAEAELLAVLVLVRLRLLRANAEVVAEVGAERGDPGNGPAHAPAIGLDPGNRRPRDERE